MRIPRLVTRELELEQELEQLVLSKRDAPAQGQSSMVLGIAFVAIIFVALVFYLALRSVGHSHSKVPSWVPSFLKCCWPKPRVGSYTPTASSSATAEEAAPTNGRPQHRDRPSQRDRNVRSARHRDPGQGVDRVTSIRSIMTLPEYRPVAEPDKERTIGREGERGGIDVVIEFPETLTEEEERREEHMAALYEIRLARQQERTEAREATATNGGANESRRNRDRGNSASARGRNRDGSSSTSLAAALAAVQERDRRLSNVAYAKVGYVRPDGTRVRGGSTASDNLPLLSSGASMGHDRNVSVESVDMFSARPSMETRGGRSSSADSRTRPVVSMLDVGPDLADERPPEYMGTPLEPPPDYERLHEGHEMGLRGEHRTEVPLLRLEAATPDSLRAPAYPPQAR